METLSQSVIRVMTNTLPVSVRSLTMFLIATLIHRHRRSQDGQTGKPGPGRLPPGQLGDGVMNQTAAGPAWYSGGRQHSA
jgi:hypothetical protein